MIKLFSGCGYFGGSCCGGGCVVGDCDDGYRGDCYVCLTMVFVASIYLFVVSILLTCFCSINYTRKK